jgi:peptide/nickel transport system substrate-binding protein
MTRFVFLMLSLIAALIPAASQTGELRFCLRSEPKTFDPYLVDDESSDTIRYLTAGVLIRLNRLTQKLEPELAVSWRVLDAGKRITFNLRKGVTFSDGTSFMAEDVASSVRRMMDPQLHSPLGDSFRATESCRFP